MNNVSIIGRLTKDVELRYIPSTNTPVCSFDIAVDDGWGEKKKTFFFKCQAWQKTAENIVKFFSKGDLIGLSGRLSTRDWTDKDGKKHTVTEIVVNDFTFCNGKKSDFSNESRIQNYNTGSERAPAPHSDYPASPIDEDDELPF
jgi:single-strand DNA-binding protein